MKWTGAEANAGSLRLVSPLSGQSRFWPLWSNFSLPLQVEQVSQLAVFIEAALDYHRQSTEILQELQKKLQIR